MKIVCYPFLVGGFVDGEMGVKTCFKGLLSSVQKQKSFLDVVHGPVEVSKSQKLLYVNSECDLKVFYWKFCHKILLDS
jgi:hypothetical protein